MLFHYVTITGIVIDNNITSEDYLYEESVSSENQGVYFRVQSWGHEYYMRYSDFIGYNYAYDDAHGYLIFIG